MCTLVHFWNIMTKKERFAALFRLAEMAMARFKLNEELMAELPLERYKVRVRVRVRGQRVTLEREGVWVGVGEEVEEALGEWIGGRVTE